MTVALQTTDDQAGHAARCGATNRQNGQCCRNPQGFRTDHPGVGRCFLHGGTTPSHRRAAANATIEAQARIMFGKIVDDQPVTNPLDVYAELAGEVRGWLSVLRQLVADLTTPGYRNEATGEQIRAEVQLYERAMDRANTVLATYARLNIDTRLAAIEAAKAAMVMAAIESALSVAGVTGSRAIEAKRAAAQKLRVLEGTVLNVEPTPELGAP